MIDEASVSVSLSHDEALVLFELLHRWEDIGTISSHLEQGESAALSAISAALESQLVAPFADHYNDLVRAARQRLAEGAGT